MKKIDILELPEDARDLIRECEAQGERTQFERNGRPVAVLVSYDEYMALRETIDIANDSLLFAKIAEADEETPVEFDRRLPRLRITTAAKAGLDAIEGVDRRLVLSTLARISDNPIAGAPLFDPLKGLWSHRVGVYRIIYKIVAEARSVVILVINSAP
ncbi:MAG TPA: type II toxin-antitoxin system prevent-host-death family antitoxin [Thermoanaerobaculia bacterium]|nr:type II toxin-antitoxin system prevent-host-death family antitoxin [Thermoanaerobaculia bacterium]